MSILSWNILVQLSIMKHIHIYRIGDGVFFGYVSRRRKTNTNQNVQGYPFDVREIGEKGGILSVTMGFEH